MNYKINS